MTPYIGITGFTTAEQVQLVFQGFQPPIERKFMVGVLMGDKTLRGIPTKWDTRRPSPPNIAGIFSDCTDLLNIIHFRSDSEGDALVQELVEVTLFGGPNLHGLQLNMTWPASDVIEQYRSQFPQSQIVLQIGRKSFEEVQQSPAALVRRLEEYHGLINYVLLDKSEGLGKVLNTQDLISFVEELYRSDGGTGIVIAGGLSADNLHRIESMVTKFPCLSIDAEGQLRTSEDTLDIERCRSYLVRSLEIF